MSSNVIMYIIYMIACFMNLSIVILVFLAFIYFWRKKKKKKKKFCLRAAIDRRGRRRGYVTTRYKARKPRGAAFIPAPL